MVRFDIEKILLIAIGIHWRNKNFFKKEEF